MPNKQAKLQQELTAQQQARRQRQLLLAMLVVGGVVIVIFGAFMLLFSQASGRSPVGKYDKLYQGVTSSGVPVLGDSHAAFIIAEIADFGCTNCLGYQPTVTQIIDQYVRTGQVRFAFVTVRTHQYSDVASQAALCAGNQHKFWEMHDALFDIQARSGTDSFTLANLQQTAVGLGVDGSIFSDCITGGSMRSSLTTAEQFYKQVQATGTPTLLWTDDGVNWQHFIADNNQPYSEGGVPFAIITRTLVQYFSTHKS